MNRSGSLGGLGGFFQAVWRAVVQFRRSLLLTLAIIALAVLLINGGYYVVSAKPEACLVCHYMKPYYDQWRGSAHNGVGCIECHPGRRTLIDTYLLRYMTASYNRRPQADVKTTSCLHCHAEEALKGEITYRRGIRFNHEHHLGQMRRGKKLRCTSCHATGMPDAHLSVDTEACFLCHFKDADKGRAFTSCNACHGVPQGKVEHQSFGFDHSAYSGAGIDCAACHTAVAKGGGDVPQSKCYECHVERLDARPDLNAVHRIHITEHGVDCFRCHDRIVHGNIEMAQAFELDCHKCHQPQHNQTVQMYIGAGGEGVPNTPSAMFTARVSCGACHAAAPGSAATWGEKKAACVHCHGAGFDAMLDDWKRELDRLATETKSVYQHAERQANALPASKIVEREELRRARVNVGLLERGRPVHNPFYSIKLAGQVSLAADAVARAVGAPRPARPQMIAQDDGSCRMCHKSMPFSEDLKFERMNFPHGLHADVLELACTKCHSPDKHRQRVIAKSECMQCHHQETEISCAHCHYEQNGFYSGDFPELKLKRQPDPMSAGGVGCKDCHNLTAGKPSREGVREQCIACHDDSYGRMLDEWLADSDSRLQNLQMLLESVASSGPPAGADSVAWGNNIAQCRDMAALLTRGKPAHNRAAFDKKLAEARSLLGGASVAAGAATRP